MAFVFPEDKADFWPQMGYIWDGDKWRTKSFKGGSGEPAPGKESPRLQIDAETPSSRTARPGVRSANIKRITAITAVL